MSTQGSRLVLATPLSVQVFSSVFSAVLCVCACSHSLDAVSALPLRHKVGRLASLLLHLQPVDYKQQSPHPGGGGEGRGGKEGEEGGEERGGGGKGRGGEEGEERGEERGEEGRR